MASIKAVIFDLDGTLVDTLPDIARCMNEILSTYGHPGFDVGDYRQWVGGGSKTMVRQIAGQLREAEDPERFLTRYVQHYRENLCRLSRLFDGVLDILHTCQKAKWPIAVLSNKDQDMIEPLCAKLMPQVVFRHLIGLSDAYPKKPDPASALHIAAQLGVAPQQCLFVGDTRIDMSTAQAAGMQSAAAAWGYGTWEELKTTKPDFIFLSPKELNTFLSSSNMGNAHSFQQIMA